MGLPHLVDKVGIDETFARQPPLERPDTGAADLGHIPDGRNGVGQHGRQHDLHACAEASVAADRLKGGKAPGQKAITRCPWKRPLGNCGLDKDVGAAPFGWAQGIAEPAGQMFQAGIGMGGRSIRTILGPLAPVMPSRRSIMASAYCSSRCSVSGSNLTV